VNKIEKRTFEQSWNPSSRSSRYSERIYRDCRAAIEQPSIGLGFSFGFIALLLAGAVIVPRIYISLHAGAR
jgi:hypothetical protein